MDDPGASAPRPSRRGWRLALVASLAAHLAILAGLPWTRSTDRPAVAPAETAVAVELVDARQPASVAAPAASASAAPPGNPRPSPASPPRRGAPAADGPDAPQDPGDDGRLADGAAIGSGGPGGGGGGTCDMAARIETALGRDALARAALAGAAGRTTVVWNGDWVKSPGEAGKGLAAVREAVMWEVAFAPRECRGQAVRGGVVLTIDAPGGAVRLFVGTDRWRWSDLLAPGGGLAGRSGR